MNQSSDSPVAKLPSSKHHSDQTKTSNPDESSKPNVDRSTREPTDRDRAFSTQASNRQPSSQRPQADSGKEVQSKPHTSSSGTNAIGHYILGKALGEGTFGKVKLGTHVLTGEKVAVKVLEKSKIKDKKDVERISREIKILKQLHHPNVVQIYEIIETEKDLYLVMEYANGGELFDLIVQNQKLKEKQASRYLQELVAGVHYIHKLGICHRDLKPENLLIDFDGSLKVVDFGLSNMYEQGNTLKTACGSPCYAAPEMIAGNRYHGLKSDIWSVGVVLYAMLCGFLPYEDQKTSNLYKKILSAEYTLPKFLSNDAKDIIQKIFVTDPEKRITIEGLRKHPWYKLYQPENQNFNYHNEEIKVNSKLLLKLELSLGFSQESVERAVRNNKHNHLSATYYLLYKKYACQNYKYLQQQQAVSSVKPIEKTLDVEEVNKSIDKSFEKSVDKSKQTRPTSQQRSESETRSSIRVTDVKQQKTRTKKPGVELGRMPAPVQDPLVLKNHRREQSANATAGRHTKDNGWGDVRDERRTESYERPAIDEEYEIVASKAKHYEEPDKRQNPQQQAKQNEMRINYMSPSPDFRKPTQTQPPRKSSVASHNITQVTNQSLDRPILSQVHADHKDRKKEAQPEPVVNIVNQKQAASQPHPSSNTRSMSQTSQSQPTSKQRQQSQDRAKQPSTSDNKYLNSTIEAKPKQQQQRLTSSYRQSSNQSNAQRSTEKPHKQHSNSKDHSSKSALNVTQQLRQSVERTSSVNSGQRNKDCMTQEYDSRHKTSMQASVKANLSQTQKIGAAAQMHSDIQVDSNSNLRLNQTLTVSQTRPTSSGQRRAPERLQADNKEFIEQANDIANLITSLNMSVMQNPYVQRTANASAVSASNSKLPSYLDQIVDKQSLQRQLMAPQSQTGVQLNQANQPYKSIHTVDMSSSTSVHKPEHDTAMMIKDLKIDPKTGETKGNAQVLYQQKSCVNSKSSGSKENKYSSNASKRSIHLNNTQVIDNSDMIRTIEEEITKSKHSGLNASSLFNTQPLSSQIQNIHQDLKNIQLSLQQPNFSKHSPTYIRADYDIDKAQQAIHDQSTNSVQGQAQKKATVSKALTVKTNTQNSNNSNAQKTSQKSATSTKHNRNPPILLQDTMNSQMRGVMYSSNEKPIVHAASGQSTFISSTNDSRQQQRSQSITATGHQRSDALTPKSQDPRLKANLTSFDNRHSGKGTNQKERRSSQPPAQSHNISIGTISSNQATQKYRSGSATAHISSNSRQADRRPERIEVLAHDQRFQSITHEPEHDMFKVGDAQMMLTQSMFAPNVGSKMKSQTNYYKRKQQVNSITELLNQTQPASAEMRKISIKNPDDSFVVQTNNFFHPSQNQSAGVPKKSTIISQDLGLNLQNAFSEPGRRNTDSSTRPSQVNLMAQSLLNDPKMQSIESLSQHQKQQSMQQYHQQQSYLKDLLKQTNNLTFSQSSIGQPQKPNQFTAQAKYIGNTSGLFSPTRAKSANQSGPAAGNSAIIGSPGPVASFSSHQPVNQPILNIAGTRQEYAPTNYATDVAYAQTNNSFMNLTNMFYGYPGQSTHQRQPGGVVPQPLSTQTPQHYQGYPMKVQDSHQYSTTYPHDQPHWQSSLHPQSQVPTHYQLYNQQLMQYSGMYTSHSRSSKSQLGSSKPEIHASKIESPSNHSGYVAASKNVQNSGTKYQYATSNLQADRYAQPMGLQRGSQQK